jgi:hypothetical protein
MFLTVFTAVHVVISLIGIVTGLIVMYGLLTAQPSGLTRIFLITTALTSLTGFFFPFEGFKPSYVVGALSLVVLGVAWRALNHGSRKLYVITATIGLYFNCFVLVAQSFAKVPALHELAPTQSEPPFAIAQVVLMVIFIVLSWRAVRTQS